MLIGRKVLVKEEVTSTNEVAKALALEEEPEGTDSTLALDYFGKRGPGGGIETDYVGEDYFGRIFIID